MKNILFFALVTIGFSSQAEVLNDVQIYQRCHSHLLNSAPKFNDPIILSILNKKTKGTEACVSLLNSFSFKFGARVKDTDKTAIQLLDNLFQIHASWFENKIFDSEYQVNSDVYEASPGSLYLTRAFFDESFNFKDIFKGAVAFEALRTKGRPTNSVHRNISAANGFKYGLNSVATWSNVRLPEIGLLQGITNQVAVSIPGVRGTAAKPIGDGVRLNGSLGGGLLGNQNYLMRTTRERGFASNGGVHVLRRWGRALFNDFLCQDVPVVNSEDSEPYVDPNSSVPFRTTNGCVSCHASMDQVAGLIRNYSTVLTNAESTLFFAPRFHATTMTSAYEWKSEPDANYFKKTPTGKFYYRTLDGKLINRTVNNLDALGNILGQLDDTYTCAASRYVEHFTGVKYPMNKIKSDKDHPYTKLILQLGQELKSHQSPKKTVESILQSSIYTDSSFLLGDQK